MSEQIISTGGLQRPWPCDRHDGAESAGPSGLEFIDRSPELRELRKSFSEFGVRVLIVSSVMAPDDLPKGCPQTWVDIDRQALCIGIPVSVDVRLSDVVYVAAEALAVAMEFPRDPGDHAQEALVNSFALGYVSKLCGEDRAVRSLRSQIDKAQRARINETDYPRRRIALRCWAIGTALGMENRETLLRQLATVDPPVTSLVEALRSSWGDRCPRDGDEAKKALRDLPREFRSPT